MFIKARDRIRDIKLSTDQTVRNFWRYFPVKLESPQVFYLLLSSYQSVFSLIGSQLAVAVKKHKTQIISQSKLFICRCLDTGHGGWFRNWTQFSLSFEMAVCLWDVRDVTQISRKVRWNFSLNCFDSEMICNLKYNRNWYTIK